MTAVIASRTASTPKIARAYCLRQRASVVTAAGGVGTAAGRPPPSVSRSDPPGGATSVVRSLARTAESATVSPCSPCHVAMRRNLAQRGALLPQREANHPKRDWYSRRQSSYDGSSPLSRAAAKVGATASLGDRTT